MGYGKIGKYVHTLRLSIIMITDLVHIVIYNLW